MKPKTFKAAAVFSIFASIALLGAKRVVADQMPPQMSHMPCADGTYGVDFARLGGDLNAGMVDSIVTGKAGGLPIVGFGATHFDLQQREAFFSDLLRLLVEERARECGDDEQCLHWKSECLEFKTRDVLDSIRGLSANTVSRDPDRDLLLGYMMRATVKTAVPDPISLAVLGQILSSKDSDVSPQVASQIFADASKLLKPSQRHPKPLELPNARKAFQNQ